MEEPQIVVTPGLGLWVNPTDENAKGFELSRSDQNDIRRSVLVLSRSYNHAVARV